eukprot:2169529-Pyramimonas_sp.AAC.1
MIVLGSVCRALSGLFRALLVRLGLLLGPPATEAAEVSKRFPRDPQEGPEKAIRGFQEGPRCQCSCFRSDRAAVETA